MGLGSRLAFVLELLFLARVRVRVRVRVRLRVRLRLRRRLRLRLRLRLTLVNCLSASSTSRVPWLWNECRDRMVSRAVLGTKPSIRRPL